MKMIPLTQFIEVIKKQGAVGVLALWLTYTHFEVQDVKERLYNCLDKNEYYNRKPIEEKQPPLPSVKNDTVAVLENKSRKLAKK
jgi:hypothetical protein